MADTPKAPPGEDITYLPGEGDPHTVKWRGVEFKANTPIRVTNKEHIAAARGNRSFRVGNDVLAHAQQSTPTTAMEYRAWVVGWLQAASTVDSVARRWSADTPLRAACEVGHDDIAYLGTLVEPKLRQMRLTEGLSELDVAGVFVRHGVLDLPWRS
jgi:hypothetical protein